MMTNTAFKTYTQENGGRVILLLLLFSLALYQLMASGITGFAIICFIPVLILFVYFAFRYKMFVFWILCLINYFLFMRDSLLPPLPMSLYNETLEIILLAIAIIDIKDSHFDRCANLMFIMLVAWCAYCTLEVLNNTCGLGIQFAEWYAGARKIAFQIMYAFLVYTLYITSPNRLVKYLYFWAFLSLFAVIWLWKQKTFGFTHNEKIWIEANYTTHILMGGTLIRYYSIYSDAASFGIGMASTAIAFCIFAITTKIRKYRILYGIVGVACIWAMFPSGTRTATACLFAGIFCYIFLSKSIKLAIPICIFSGFAFIILAFTDIGQGNQQIRRMRTTFNRKDASANVRTINQQAMKKYLKDAPWGMGIFTNADFIPANNKFKKLSYIPPDSEYVYIWIHTGIIGISVFLITTFIMFIGACWIVLFKIRSSSLRGIGAGFCCAFVSIQLGGYGNQILMQYPNCLLYYGGLSLVYILPLMEKEWIEWESKELAIQEEKKRLKLEKKLASRV
jgi:hypothetical protein